jgi:hypothetical protein
VRWQTKGRPLPQALVEALTPIRRYWKIRLAQHEKLAHQKTRSQPGNLTFDAADQERLEPRALAQAPVQVTEQEALQRTALQAQ